MGRTEAVLINPMTLKASQPQPRKQFDRHSVAILRSDFDNETAHTSTLLLITIASLAF